MLRAEFEVALMRTVIEDLRGHLPQGDNMENAMARSRNAGLSRRRFLSLTAGAAMAASPTRVSAQPRRAGTFISAKTTEAPSLDPILEQALSRQRIDPLFYNRMVEWGHDGKLEPVLAESWTTSTDGRTWTFKLRQGVKFHNGRELAADDVKFTYERVLDPKTGSGGRGYLSAIDTIETPDKHTVRIVTKQPSASLLAGMAGGWSAIVPREVVEKGDLRRTAVGTGPFILQEWVPQSHLKARKNPDYWDKGKPAVDAIEIKVIPDEANIIAQLRTGNIHHALLEDNKNYLLVKDDKRLRALRSPRLGFDMVNINHGRKPFTDLRVRQALSLAVDRTEVLQAAASGLGSVTGPLTPAMRPWALPVEEFKEWYTPNVDRAKKLLAEAGFPNGFKTTLKVIPTFPTMVAGAQVIAAQLKKIGVDVQIIQEEYGVWIKAIIKPNFDFDLTMNATTGDADPDSLLYRRFHSSEKQWNNDGDPDIDVLLDQGRIALDPKKRKEIYDQAQRLMIEKATQIWTFAPDMIDVTQASVAYQQHFTTAYYGFRTVRLS
jgi:peptide/nickel transport system substrate-binding protein